MSHQAKDLIARLLVRDARERLSADQVLAHPWLKDVSDTIVVIVIIMPYALMDPDNLSMIMYIIHTLARMLSVRTSLALTHTININMIYLNCTLHILVYMYVRENFRMHLRRP